MPAAGSVLAGLTPSRRRAISTGKSGYRQSSPDRPHDGKFHTSPVTAFERSRHRGTVAIRIPNPTWCLRYVLGAKNWPQTA
jgi:hypothetical protein